MAVNFRQILRIFHLSRLNRADFIYSKIPYPQLLTLRFPISIFSSSCASAERTQHTDEEKTKIFNQKILFLALSFPSISKLVVRALYAEYIKHEVYLEEEKNRIKEPEARLDSHSSSS